MNQTRLQYLFDEECRQYEKQLREMAKNRGIKRRDLVVIGPEVFLDQVHGEYVRVTFQKKVA